MLLYSLLFILAVGSALLLPGTESTRLLLGLWIWPLSGWGLQSRLLAGGRQDFLTRLCFALVLPWCAFGALGTVVGALGLAPLPVTLVALTPGVLLLFASARNRMWPEFKRPSAETLWILSCALVVTALVFLAPPQLDLKSDVYAHISAVRACLEEGRVYPLHEFYSASQGLGADPRFGIVHGVLASWCQLSRSTPLQIWHSSLAFALPLFILGAGFLARSATRTLPALIATHLAFLGAFAGSFYDPIRLAAYPLWQALSILWIFFAFYFREPEKERSQKWVLRLLTLTLVGVLSIHVLAYILGCGMLLFLLLVVSRAVRRTTAKTVVTAILITLPFLLLRFWTSYGDVNPIHHRPYFLMEWAAGLVSASPGFLLAWLFPWGFLGVLLAVFQFQALRTSPIQRWAFGMSVVALIWLILPFLLMPSMKLLGFLPMRFTLLILFPLPIGFTVDRLLSNQSSRPIHRMLVGVIIFLLLLTTGRRVASTYHSSTSPMVKNPAWRELTSYCDDHLDPGAVVLSDPFSMIALRATAPVSIVALPDGRSSPRDSDSIERLRDAWKAMSPLVDGRTTDLILKRYDVRYVLVNHLFEHDLYSYEYPLDIASFSSQARKFRENQDRFREVWARSGITLYSVQSGVADWNDAYLQPVLKKLPMEAGCATQQALHDSFVLCNPRIEMSGGASSKKFTISADLAWEGFASPSERYLVIRADRVPSPVPPSFRAVGKPLRKLLGIVERKKFRFRWTKYPGTPDCPLYQLNRDSYLPLSVELPIPSSMSPGRYLVTLQLSKSSEFTVLHLSDYLSDDDIFRGPTVGELTIE